MGAAPDAPDAPDPLREFLEVMRRLRAECPWKAEQTHGSLARYLLEETHEALEAIDALEVPGGAGEDERSRDDHLREELGDLLLQVVFHAVIAEERGAFTLDDVARGITAKMRHRNPHVFDPDSLERQPADAAEVDAAWQAIKAAQKPRESALDGLPPTLPALLWATKAIERDPAIRLRPPAGDPPLDRRRIGERLLEVVAEAVDAGVDPEQALRGAVGRRTTGEPG